MSSPFSTIEEFNNAIDGPTEGAIYTFAQTPIINILALLVAIGLFIWFIVSTYTPHSPTSTTSTVDKSLNHLSALFVVGLLSLVAADHRQQVRTDPSEAVPQAGLSQSPRSQTPLGLLGMIGIGLPTFRRTTSRRKRLTRNLKSSRSRR